MNDQPDFEARRAEIREQHLRPPEERPESTARGLHHTALISSDVETTVRFYQDLLGFPLTEVIENRDYAGSTHFFFDIGNQNLLAFFDFPGLDVGPYAEVLGGLHHMAISVEPSRWEAIVGAARGRRCRARHPQRGVGLLPRPRRRPDRADRRPARGDVRRDGALGPCARERRRGGRGLDLRGHRGPVLVDVGPVVVEEAGVLHRPAARPRRSSARRCTAPAPRSSRPAARGPGRGWRSRPRGPRPGVADGERRVVRHRVGVAAAGDGVRDAAHEQHQQERTGREDRERAPARRAGLRTDRRRAAPARDAGRRAARRRRRTGEPGPSPSRCAGSG